MVRNIVLKLFLPVSEEPTATDHVILLRKQLSDAFTWFDHDSDTYWKMPELKSLLFKGQFDGPPSSCLRELQDLIGGDWEIVVSEPDELSAISRSKGHFNIPNLYWANIEVF